ncbi:hypothetical protein VFPPC_11794 [Pochonia chlamydosporia 170]|uniref:DUF7587 domain-containing protein n=1 Tax=Pochonia chlamydosporia 170 TaxID=1380566 RepID=A0A179EYG6_METCM|nr:hypothetical protein VFPPC_11794 [Pochonia chlamydosporia 170]OAQ58234.1 hypothetical protein VFPPC_11794 [Pochonia chlamydosporia 170]
MALCKLAAQTSLLCHFPTPRARQTTERKQAWKPPRTMWRVEFSRPRYYRKNAMRASTDVDLRNLSDANKRELQSCVSAHVAGQHCDHNDGPCAVTFLTGSLLWALHYAHWLLSHEYKDVRLMLVDSRNIPVEKIYPALSLAAFLDVKPLDGVWQNHSYQEYFVLGDAAGIAISKIVGINPLRSI